MKETTIKARIGGNIAMIIVSLALCGLGALLIKSGTTETKELERFFFYASGTLDIVFFSTGAGLLIRRLIAYPNGLVLNSEGIINGTTLFKPEVIPWGEIVKVEENKEKGTMAILIHVVNPHPYLKAASGLKKRLYQATYDRFSTPLSIGSKFLKLEHELVLEKINEYLSTRNES